MEENIINIATLTIDRTEANNSIVQTKQQIFELQKANGELRKDITKNGDVTGQQTQKFVENEQALKKLNAQYRAQSSAINDLTLAELKENKALTDTAKSRGQAIAQTKELKEIRDQLNTETEEGAQALELLNKKINANDAFLKGNASEQEKFRSNVGNYPTLLNNAGNAFGGVTQKIVGFVQGGQDAISSFTELGTQATASISKMIGFENATVKAANANEILSTSAGSAAKSTTAGASAADAMGEAGGNASKGIMTMVKAAWAFVANPIGLILTAIVVVLGILYKIFSSFQPVIDKFEQGFAAIAAVINVVKNTILAVITGTKSLGEAFNGLGGDMADAASEAAALTKAQQDLDDVMKAQEVTTAKNRAAINKLNVELKNRTKTERERLAIADQIAKKENEDYQQRKKIVDEEVRIARATIALKAQFTEQEKKLLKETGDATKELAESRGGTYDEEYDALNKARIKAIELENEVTVNLEKTYNRRDKLQDDAQAKETARQEKAKAAADKALQDRVKNMELDISVQRAKNAQLKQSDEERLNFLNLITKKELDLIEFKKSQGVSSEREAQLATLNILKTQSAETLALAEKTINEENEAQKKKFEEKKKLDENAYLDELANAAFLRSVQEKRIEESKLLESEKYLALLEIKTGYEESVNVIETNYAESRKQQAEIAKQEAQTLSDVAFEMRILQLEEQNLTELEIQKATLAIQLEQNKAALDQELADAKLTSAEVTAIKLLEDKKYATAVKKIDKEVAATKRAAQTGIVKDSLQAAELIFGESKALSIAMALINTYQGITAGVALGYPMAIPAVALATATGFAAVRNILKTNKDGGGAGASGGSSGGTSTPASIFENPARTQTIATVDPAPLQEIPNTVQTVLVLETLDEVKGQQQIKINSQ